MSYGTVYHVDCGGEFFFYFCEMIYVCKTCGKRWDGREKGVVTYDENQQPKEKP